MSIAARNAMLAGAAPGPAPAYWGLCFTAEQANSTVGISKTGKPTSKTILYSTDAVNWSAYTIGTDIVLENVGDKVWMKAGEGGNSGSWFTSIMENYRFKMTGLIAASGNLMSIVDGETETFTAKRFQSLFDGCTSLTTAPALPATTLVNGCYYSMFHRCTSLTTAPALPATTLVNDCYSSMFSGCTALTTAPALPATTLSSSCYRQMFSGCTALTTAPALPATKLVNSCYRQMFYRCTALTTAPALPATMLATHCYYQMFSGCTALTTAPSLPATTLEDSCYHQMFSGCELLNEITAGIITWTPSSGSAATADWLSGIAATGTFHCSTALGTDETIERGADYCPEGWTVINTDGYWGLCFTAEESNVVVNMVKNGSPPAVTLETSPDGVTWTAFDANGGTTPITLAAVGDKVYFRAGSAGNSKITSDHANSRSFTISAACSASGSISSILSQDTPVFNLSTDNSFAFYGLFSGCTALTTAPALPATTLAVSCYRNMFSGCTALTTAPALPATTLEGACYWAMFQNCTALTTAPALPATKLVNSCYYQMFSGCTALTTAPSLPATTLEDSCYWDMFRNCTALTTVEVGFAAFSPTNATTDWLNGVAATGTFRCPTALGTDATITRGTNACPAGWTVINTDA